ncbi:pyruvate oxidase [bacterium]|nr:pyruvate oxidase [bacterium]
MAITASDILIEKLLDWHVDTIFGLPGDGINGIMEALRTRQDKIRFIQVRHEETAAFMACGYAKYTGKLGVCLATSGPGAIHLLNGLYDAKMDGAPVLAITGTQFHDLLRTYGQQDVNLEALFEDVTVYNTRAMSAAHIETITDLACRHALGLRGVAHITIPVDLQEMEIDEEKTSMRYRRGHTSDVFAHPRTVPHEDALQRAADLLNEAKNIVILCGSGAYGAREELESAAETLGAPIVKALLGKGVVPDASPYTTGGIGLLGTVPSQDALAECDALLWVGSSFPYMEFLPKPGQARTVQIDLDPARIGLRYPTEVPLVGDSKHTLVALLPLLKRKADRSFLEKAQAAMQDWKKRLQERGSRRDKPMKPQVVAHELNKLLDNDAVIACDSGTITSMWARYIEAREQQQHAVSGNLASMACALPYAMAAQVAFSERQCVAIIGDGGFTMLMGELATCIKYNLPVKIIIFKNNTLGQIRWEQMLFLGNPEFGCELQPINFAMIAQAFGATGITIEDPADCGQQLRQALSTPGPVVVEAVVDPNELPMPPHLKPDYAENLAQALAKGESDLTEILGATMQERIRKLI